MALENFSLKDSLANFKEDMLESKKYWILSLFLIIVFFFATMKFKNYSYPKFEIIALIFSCIASVFLISFYQGHRDEKNFYKTAFVVILVFGIVFSIITPIMCSHDEFEHFVRAEITSNGVINPEYNETPFTLEGITYDGSYMTIQSAYDLVQEGKVASDYIKGDLKQLVKNNNGTPVSDYIRMDTVNSSVMNTNADTMPINTTKVPFHSAFTQNPFFGYLAPAIGIALAKMLSLNSIWMLWLGRICNVVVYAGLVAYAVKKTPILKMPLFVIACIPATLSQASSVSIDPMVNGLAILAIAYFLYYYNAPENSLDYTDILKFSAIVLLLGLCKVTYFSFIMLLLFLPRDNFRQRKYYYSIVLVLLAFLGVMAVWSKFWVNPGIHNSWRYSLYLSKNNVDALSQISYMMGHLKESFVTIFHLVGNLDNDLKVQSFIGTKFISIYLLFIGTVYLLYPHEKIKPKTKIGALLVFCMVYFGTYILYILTWNKVGDLHSHGIQARYFFPALGLIPIFLGINHVQKDTTEIDSYIIMLAIVFVIFRILTLTLMVY